MTNPVRRPAKKSAPQLLPESKTLPAENSLGGYGRVLAFLRQQLMSGGLKAGDKLMSERELAATLDVSRAAVREAVRALAMIGVVETRHGGGTHVRAPDVSVLSQFFSLALAQQSDIVEDIMQVRVALERHAIALACDRAGQQDIANMSEALDRIEETIGDPLLGGQADYQFHKALVHAAGSQALEGVYDAISTVLMHSHVERRRKMPMSKEIESYLIDHHRAILNAVVERDHAQADLLLRRHFEIGAEVARRIAAQAARPLAVPDVSMQRQSKKKTGRKPT